MTASFRSRIVVGGGSLAEQRRAEALRRNGYAGALTIVGNEPYAPYDRPQISKHVLAGDLPAEATGLPSLVPLDVRWRLGERPVARSLAIRRVTLRDRSEHAFDRLLVASGARERLLPAERGGDPSEVFTLRSRDDAAALRAALAGAPRSVFIVGGGLIGCEAASFGRELGLGVTLVDPNPTLLARVLGTLVCGAIVACLWEAGVDSRPGRRVRWPEGDAFGRMARARLARGKAIDVNLVVALGATRETGWLAEAGLRADGYVLSADGTPADGVYAARDVARCPSLLHGGRLVCADYRGNALEQTEHAAANMPAPRIARRSTRSSRHSCRTSSALTSRSRTWPKARITLPSCTGRWPCVASSPRTAAADDTSSPSRSIKRGGCRPTPRESRRAAPIPPICDALDQPSAQLHAPGFPGPRTNAPHDTHSRDFHG